MTHHDNLDYDDDFGFSSYPWDFDPADEFDGVPLEALDLSNRRWDRSPDEDPYEPDYDEMLDLFWEDLESEDAIPTKFEHLASLPRLEKVNPDAVRIRTGGSARRNWRMDSQRGKEKPFKGKQWQRHKRHRDRYVSA